MTVGVHKESISHYRRCNVSLSPLLKHETITLLSRPHSL